MNVWTILAFVLYLGAMLYIGFLFSKKSNNVGDYFLGGRGMGSWLTALSAQASDMSSWLLMGLPSAGRAMAKHNSSIGSSVKGECIGKSRSSTESETERRMLQ